MADKTEQEFQKTMENSPWHAEFVQRYGEKPDLREGGDYNYRLAVNNNIQPQPDPYDKNSLHWPSSFEDSNGNIVMLKSPDHKTAWKEYYMRANNGVNPDAVGATEADWNKSTLNMGPVHMGIGGLAHYNKGEQAAESTQDMIDRLRALYDRVRGVSPEPQPTPRPEEEDGWK